MNSTDVHFWEMSDTRQDAWIRDRYPDIAEDTEAWETAVQDYDDYLAWEDASNRQMWFEASLHIIQDRYDHAIAELDALELLLDSPQANIVMRLAYVHCVTVMEAFLLYAARALLNHHPHLARFRQYSEGQSKKSIYCQNLGSAKVNKAISGIINNEKPWLCPNCQWVEDVYRLAAQDVLGRMTFHNLGFVREYFQAMLETPHRWSCDQLQHIVEHRQDLVHRNGVSKDDRPINIEPLNLRRAIKSIRGFINEAARTLLAENAKHGGDTKDVGGEYGF